MKKRYQVVIRTYLRCYNTFTVAANSEDEAAEKAYEEYHGLSWDELCDGAKTEDDVEIKGLAVKRKEVLKAIADASIDNRPRRNPTTRRFLEKIRAERGAR